MVQLYGQCDRGLNSVGSLLTSRSSAALLVNDELRYYRPMIFEFNDDINIQI